MLRIELSKVFANHQITFDLEDCDKILRIKALDNTLIQPSLVIALMKNLGFSAEVLPDTIIIDNEVKELQRFYAN
jgi:hypothetical protein